MRSISFKCGHISESRVYVPLTTQTVSNISKKNESLTSYEVVQVIEFLSIRVPDSKFTEKITSKIYAK
jgi:hypothetical protein